MIDDYEYEYEIEDQSVYENSVADTFTDNNTVTSQMKKQRKLNEDYKKLDSDFNSIKMRVDGVLKKIEFYETGMTPGKKIRCAVTGSRFNQYRVGSLAEDLFFKVCYAVGDLGKRDSSFLFFDNPEQYERHFHCNVTTEVKEKWNEKYQREWRKRNL
jgi:hypothetical protein